MIWRKKQRHNKPQGFLTESLFMPYLLVKICLWAFDCYSGFGKSRNSTHSSRQRKTHGRVHYEVKRFDGVLLHVIVIMLMSVVHFFRLMKMQTLWPPPNDSGSIRSLFGFAQLCIAIVCCPFVPTVTRQEGTARWCMCCLWYLSINRQGTQPRQVTGR